MDTTPATDLERWLPLAFFFGVLIYFIVAAAGTCWQLRHGKDPRDSNR